MKKINQKIMLGIALAMVAGTLITKIIHFEHHTVKSTARRLMMLMQETKQTATQIPQGITAPEQPGPRQAIVGPDAVQKELALISLQQNIKGAISISLSLPHDDHLIDGYPAQYLVQSDEDAPLLVAAASQTGAIQGAVTTIPFTTGTRGQGTLEVQLSYGYCSGKDRKCIPREIIWRIPFAIVHEQGAAQIELMDQP